MGPYYYIVDSIAGDYAYLKRTDIENEELFQVAMALLPADINIDTRLKWENLIYTVEE